MFKNKSHTYIEMIVDKLLTRQYKQQYYNNVAIIFLLEF